MRMSEAEYAAYLRQHGQVPLVGPSEAAVMQALRRLALSQGYYFYHPYSSKRSEPGWPDVALVHPRGDTTLYLLECKRTGEQPTLAQQRWLDALSRVTRVESGVVWPETLPQWLARLLAAPTARATAARA